MDVKKDIKLYKNKIYTIAKNIYLNLNKKNNLNENNILLLNTNIIDIFKHKDKEKCLKRKKYNYNYFIIEHYYMIFHNDENRIKLIYETKILISNYIYILKYIDLFNLKKLYFYKIIKNNKYNKNIKLLYCNKNINIYHNYHNYFNNYKFERSRSKCNNCFFIEDKDFKYHFSNNNYVYPGYKIKYNLKFYIYNKNYKYYGPKNMGIKYFNKKLLYII